MTGWYITANDIKHWVATNKKQSESLLPELIKRLILASDKNADVDFPSGDSVSNEGWDGIVKTNETSKVVPLGVSGWEIGTDYSVKGKADDDYKKRTSDSQPLDKKECTFVFVSPRHWAKRDSWVKEQLEKKEWKDVQAHNAESLANWLHETPVAHRWFAEVIGKRLLGMWDIEQAWAIFSNYTSKQFTTDFFIKGNEETEKTLLEKIDTNYKITIQATSFVEFYGFVLSVLLKNELSKYQTLVVDDQNSWDWATSNEQPLIIIPKNFIPEGIGIANRSGHKVILYSDNYDRNADIKLTRPKYLERVKGIESIGFDEDVASTIYRDTKGYTNPILRHDYLEPKDMLLPKWPSQFNSNILLATLFATQWNTDNENDKAILSSLSGKSYEDFEKQVYELSKQQDPPIRQVGNIWQVISKIDFWFHINTQLSRESLNRLQNAMKAVFTDLDPAFDLDADERYMANINGAIPLYSSHLKTGIADTLALLATFGDDSISQSDSANSPSQLIKYWVRDLFDKNTSLKFWYSLGSTMRSIAESAPEEFLNAIEKASEGQNPILLGLIESGSNGTFGGCSHADLLWSLERLAWSKEYLAQASICLAQLSEIDPGGTWSNRPQSSLNDIFLGWMNHTSASHKQRLELIKHVLIKNHPEITWNLLVSLLPKSIGGMTSGTNKPDYRNWAQETEQSVSNKDYYEYGQGIIEILLEEANKKPLDYGLDLLEQYSNFSEKQIHQALKVLEKIDTETISTEDRNNVLDKIRRYVCFHDREEKKDNDLSQFIFTQLKKIYSNLNFQDPVNKHTHLFNNSPVLIDHPEFKQKNSWKEQDKLIREAQLSAVTEVYTSNGIEGISDLASNCDNPYSIGYYLEDVKNNFSVHEPLIFDWIVNDEMLSSVAKAYFSRRIRDNPQWGSDVLSSKIFQNSKKVSIFYSYFPTTLDTFNHLDKESIEVQQQYWDLFIHPYLDDKNCVPYVVKKLLKYNKPLTAIDCAATVFRNDDEILKQLNSQLIADILTSIATKENTNDNVSFQNVHYDVSQAIKLLQDRHDLDDNKITQIEWLYLKAFEYDSVSPKFLYKVLANDPSFFVQLIIWSFKRSDGKEDEDKLPDNIAEQNIDNAYTLLRKCNLLPSQKESDLDTQTLAEYISKARILLSDAARTDIGDSKLGEYLSYCPKGVDGIWPHEAVRDVIENIKSESFESGFQVGKYNQRGVTTRSHYEGGEQERDLANRYFEGAEKLQFSYPRTANILKKMGESYIYEAKRCDQDTELNI